MKRLNKCIECGGILGHHMTGCPETPEPVYTSAAHLAACRAKVEALSSEDCRALLNQIIEELYPDENEEFDSISWSSDTADNISCTINDTLQTL